MTCLKGIVSIVFPETLDVPRGKAKCNIEGRGETKLTISREVLLIMPPNSK